MRPEHWLFTIPVRLRSLFRWTRADQALDEELRDHLDRKTEEYVAQGMTREEAHRRARIDLDGIEQTKEKYRDARRVNWIQDFVQDLHFGLRTLRKSPGFTAVVVVTLALGIGANTAIFSLINALRMRTLPVQKPDELVLISPANDRNGSLGFSYPLYEAIRDDNRTLAGVFVRAGGAMNVSVDGQAGTNGSRHPFHHQGRGINPSDAMRCALAQYKPSPKQHRRPIFAAAAVRKHRVQRATGGNRIIDEFSMSAHEAFDGLPSMNLGTQLSGDGIYQV